MRMMSPTPLMRGITGVGDSHYVVEAYEHTDGSNNKSPRKFSLVSLFPQTCDEAVASLDVLLE